MKELSQALALHNNSASEIERLRALEAEIQPKIDSVIVACDPAQPNSFEAIGALELQRRVIALKVGHLQRVLAERSDDLETACLAAHTKISEGINAKSDALRAFLRKQARAMTSDEQVLDRMVHDAFAVHPIARNIYSLEYVLKSTLKGSDLATLLLSTAEKLNAITVPTK